MRVFVKSCCRAIGMTLALVWVPRISEAADHQVWLKLSIDVPIFAPWDDDRIVFDAEQEEKFGKRGFIDSETLPMIKLEACPYFAIRLGDRFVYERSRGRGDLVPEHRPTLDVVLTTPEFLTLKLDSRTRFELHDDGAETVVAAHDGDAGLHSLAAVADFIGHAQHSRF